MVTCFKPTGISESTDRTLTDYFHFGIIFPGLVLAAAGVVTLLVGAYIFGLLLSAFGTAYFWMEE